MHKVKLHRDQWPPSQCLRRRRNAEAAAAQARASMPVESRCGADDGAGPVDSWEIACLSTQSRHQLASSECCRRPASPIHSLPRPSAQSHCQLASPEWRQRRRRHASAVHSLAERAGFPRIRRLLLSIDSGVPSFRVGVNSFSPPSCLLILQTAYVYEPAKLYPKKRGETGRKLVSSVQTTHVHRF